MVLDTLLKEKREEIFEIVARYGGSNVRIFGSVARGEAGLNSDIDLLIDLEPGRSLLDLAGVKLDLEKLLQRHVDVFSEDSLKTKVLEHALRDAVRL